MTATDYTAKARELVCAAYADFGVGLPDLEPMTAIFAAALREAVEAEREACIGDLRASGRMFKGATVNADEALADVDKRIRLRARGEVAK